MGLKVRGFWDLGAAPAPQAAGHAGRHDCGQCTALGRPRQRCRQSQGLTVGEVPSDLVHVVGDVAEFRLADQQGVLIAER